MVARPTHGSSHALGVGEAVELARALDRLPPQLELIGITGECFAPALGLTPVVAAAVASLVDELAGTEVSA